MQSAAVPPFVSRRSPYVLITGGAGFVGANLADRLAAEGRHVLVLDALARKNVEQNLDWLTRRHGARVASVIADIRDADAVREAVRGAEAVYHLAAQVAVTCSVADPVTDFEVNARGTLNVLEAIRAQESPPPLLFTSTNKVYGTACSSADLEESDRRYLAGERLAARGFSEMQPLDLHSPYGCSKGAADQYVLDYTRIFGIRAVVFRMSCIYGPRQFGNEDQGWVAHFLRAAVAGETITIYGNGKQVRDILFISDLVDAMLAAQQRMPVLAGRAFNIGGGAEQSVSLLEVLDLIEQRLGARPQVAFGETRPGDQPYYVSDTTAFRKAAGWHPKVGLAEGIERLLGWLKDFAEDPETPPVAEVRACASR